MNTVKWGILSTADIAQTQLIPAIQRAHNAEVIAIASRGPKVHSIAQACNISTAYESYEELLEDPNVEVVYIPLPNDMHKKWAIRAARAGKHVLCEKPVVLERKDLEEILTVFNEEGKLFMEAFMYQLHPQHARVREIIKNGEIGQVMLFKSSHSFYFHNRNGNIRMDKSKGGGALWDVGCYSLHAMNVILGLTPKSISFDAMMDTQTGVDLTAFGTVKLQKGVLAMIDCSFDMIDRNEYEIVGTEGTIKVKYAFRPDILSGNGQIVITTGTVERIEQIAGDIYKLEVEYFSNKVLQKGNLNEQHQLSITNITLLEAAYQSIKLKKEIVLNVEDE